MALPKKKPAFKLKTETFLPNKERRHRYGIGNHITCVTDTKGYAQPDGRDLKEIRVDATNGYIPLATSSAFASWCGAENSRRSTAHRSRSTKRGICESKRQR